MGSGVKVGELFAELHLDRKGFEAGLTGAGKGFSNLGKMVQKAGKVIGLAIGAAIAAVIALGVAASGNAVEQERATARVVATYGEAGAAVTKWAQDNALALGINDDVLELSMAQYGDWAKNVGMSTEEAMASGKDMVKRAQEISLATGKSFEEVFDGLFKGQQGMTRGLKTYGITIDKTALRNEALRQGWIKEGDAMNAATEARARGNLILQQSTQFTKVAADMQGGLVQKQRQVAVLTDSVMDALGTLFLNLAQVIMPIVVDAFAGLAEWVTANMPTIQAVIQNVMGAIGTAIGIVSSAISAIMPTLQAAFDWLTDNGKDLTPILAAIGAVILAVVVPAIVSMVIAMGPIIIAIAAIAGAAALLAKAWSSNFLGIRDIARNVFNFLTPIFNTIINIAKVVIPAALRVLSAAFGFVVNAIKVTWGPLIGFFMTLWSNIGNIVKGGINIILGAINGFIRFVNGIKIHIPRVGVGPLAVGPFDWGGLRLKQIPYLAEGVRNFGGGMAVVGEKGPELARLPRGTDVFSNARSRGMMSGGITVQGPLVAIEHFEGTEVEVKDVSRKLAREVRLRFGYID